MAFPFPPSGRMIYDVVQLTTPCEFRQDVRCDVGLVLYLVAGSFVSALISFRDAQNRPQRPFVVDGSIPAVRATLVWQGPCTLECVLLEENFVKVFAQLVDGPMPAT